MKLGFFAALLMLVFVAIVGIDAYQKIRRQPGPPSTYNAGSAGYKALYLWLREMGVPVKRWERPFTELTREADSARDDVAKTRPRARMSSRLSRPGFGAGELWSSCPRHGMGLQNTSALK